MPEVTYKLSLKFKQTGNPVGGFKVIVRALGTGGGATKGQILFPPQPAAGGTQFASLHPGGDPAPFRRK